MGGQEEEREVLRTKIKMYDKKPVLEMLAKRADLLKPEQVEVNVKQTINEEDKEDMVRRVAFMLAKASKEKPKKKQKE